MASPFITGSADISSTEVTTEGLSATNAISYHSHGIRGAGVKITIIDQAFGELSEAIQAGEFGSPSTIDEECTKNYTAVPPTVGIDAVDIGDDHGTRVAQIVHDMAPEATLCLKLIGNFVAHYSAAVQDALSEESKIILDTFAVYGASYYGRKLAPSQKSHQQRIC